MRVLIVGSLAGELGKAAKIAMARGASLTQADSVGQAIEKLRQGAGELVLCDVMHDVGALTSALERERIVVPVIACGENTSADVAVRAIKDGAKDFLPLPPDADLIAAMLETASSNSRDLIGDDPLTRETVRRAEQIARSEASVLLTGESGTGKEVFARHIHTQSRRSAGPFVAVNCAAIPEHLLESELFGYEKGAFSGAVARRVGRFEAASGGTLLLDEIGEMDMRLQAKMLRAIQEREIDRVGGAAPVKINVRIIASTNRDLDAAVAEGRFREDLLFRLNVVALRLPPLRERPRDVPVLAAFFAHKYAELNGFEERAFTPAALSLLQNYPWPGNVRELENAVHRAVLLAEGDALDESAIELPGVKRSISPALADAQILSAQLTPAAEASGTLIGRTVEEVERTLILDTLTHCLGNRTQAAMMLGISIRTLRNKLREYTSSGVSVPRPYSGVAGA